jgi:hypothetical protein
MALPEWEDKLTDNTTGSVLRVLWEHLHGLPVFSKENVWPAVWEETKLRFSISG